MTILCSLEEIGEGEAKGFYITRGAFFAIKKNANIYVYRNLCPHQGTPLEWQENKFLDPDGDLIQCASHGALFKIESGECIYGPCAGQTLLPAKFQIKENKIVLS